MLYEISFQIRVHFYQKLVKVAIHLLYHPAKSLAHQDLLYMDQVISH